MPLTTRRGEHPLSDTLTKFGELPLTEALTKLAELPFDEVMSELADLASDSVSWMVDTTTALAPPTRDLVHATSGSARHTRTRLLVGTAAVAVIVGGVIVWRQWRHRSAREHDRQLEAAAEAADHAAPGEPSGSM